jgi:hypothetical protein
MRQKEKKQTSLNQEGLQKRRQRIILRNGLRLLEPVPVPVPVRTP